MKPFRKTLATLLSAWLLIQPTLASAAFNHPVVLIVAAEVIRHDIDIKNTATFTGATVTATNNLSINATNILVGAAEEIHTRVIPPQNHRLRK